MGATSSARALKRLLYSPRCSSVAITRTGSAFKAVSLIAVSSSIGASGASQFSTY